MIFIVQTKLQCAFSGLGRQRPGDICAAAESALQPPLWMDNFKVLHLPPYGSFLFNFDGAAAQKGAGLSIVKTLGVLPKKHLT